MSVCNPGYFSKTFLDNKGNLLNIVDNTTMPCDNLVELNRVLSQDEIISYQEFFKKHGLENSSYKINFVNLRKCPDIYCGELSDDAKKKFYRKIRKDKVKRKDASLENVLPFDYINSNQKAICTISNKVAVSREFINKYIMDITKANKLRQKGDSVLLDFCMLVSRASVGKRIEAYTENKNSRVNKISKSSSKYVRNNLDRGCLRIEFKEPYNQRVIDWRRVNEPEKMCAAEYLETKTVDNLRTLIKKLKEYDLIEFMENKDIDTCYDIVIKIKDYDNEGKNGRGYYFNNGYVLISKKAINKCLRGVVSEADAFLDILFNTVTVEPNMPLSEYIPVALFEGENYEINEEDDKRLVLFKSEYLKMDTLANRWHIQKPAIFNRLQKFVKKGLLTYYAVSNGKGIVISPSLFCKYFLGVTEPVMPGESAIAKIMHNSPVITGSVNRTIKFRMYSTKPCSDEFPLLYNKIEQFGNISLGDEYNTMINDDLSLLNSDYITNLGTCLHDAIIKEEVVEKEINGINVSCKKAPTDFSLDVYLSRKTNESDYKFTKLIISDAGTPIRIHSNSIDLLRKEFVYKDISNAIGNWHYKKLKNYYPTICLTSFFGHIAAQYIMEDGSLHKKGILSIIERMYHWLSEEEWRNFFYKPISYETFLKRQVNLKYRPK